MSGRKKVWLISRFELRFELRGRQSKWCRDTPLVFTRDFVSAHDDESASYLAQLDALSRRRNGLELEGAYVRLRRHASRQSKNFRGYLLTAEKQPASDAYLARYVLFCDARRARRLLKALADVGLLRQVTCPNFAQAVPSRRRAKPAEKAAQARQRAPGSRSKSLTKSRNVRTAAHDGARLRNSLRAKANEKPNDNGKLNRKKQSVANGQPQRPRTATPPAAAPPESQSPEPPEATQGRCPSAPARGPSLRDAEPTILALPGVSRLGPVCRDALPDHDGRVYSDAAKEYGGQVYAKLRCPWLPTEQQGRRNLGNFAAAYDDAVKAGLSGAALTEACEKAMADAEKIGKHRARYTGIREGKNPERYWRFRWNLHVEARRAAGREVTSTG